MYLQEKKKKKKAFDCCIPVHNILSDFQDGFPKAMRKGQTREQVGLKKKKKRQALDIWVGLSCNNAVMFISGSSEEETLSETWEFSGIFLMSLSYHLQVYPDESVVCFFFISSLVKASDSHSPHFLCCVSTNVRLFSRSICILSLAKSQIVKMTFPTP